VVHDPSEHRLTDPAHMTETGSTGTSLRHGLLASGTHKALRPQSRLSPNPCDEARSFVIVGLIRQKVGESRD